MALGKVTISDDYPIPVYSYRVTIDGSQTMSFSEVSGLEIDYDYVDYRHGLGFLMGINLIRGQAKPVKVNLKRGVTKHREYLTTWLDKGDKRDVLIELCDEDGTGMVSWQVSRALPFKLDAPAFNADSNSVAIESMELVAHGLTIKHQK
ncbi:phage tail protein [Fulvivirga sediminis]|uniref:Phage tail protein n=1 Tax=Fulvivirga sediminis TaxID=2803949 RepID=A0A937F7K1_9BACT|nr:phage tail protein [Fulvivirga sediminis]MBL3655543.1 phage tail protein [Fulvivirga sediminis]